MSQSSGPEKKKKSTRRGLLPLIGLIFALLLGVVAFFLAPPLLEFAEGQSPKFESQFNQFRADYGEKTIEYIAAGFLWLVLLGLTMFFAALFTGGNPDKVIYKQMGPSPTDKKAMYKAQKKRLKELQQKKKQLKGQK